MESINSNEANLRSREISISFAKVEREPNTKRTLVLKYPNKYIPQFMEDLADIPLVLHIGDQTKTVAIEVANIKSYTLRVKMKSRKCKILVLTPTNKAADVLVKRIMEVSCNDESYKKWLVRFGATGDEEIEQSSVFKDKTFDIRAISKNVTVTTIARFSYDFFMPQGARVFLHGIKWDYIVIDEASMIPLANIVFPLYKKTPEKFIIAGDPFQIEPITSVDL